MAKRTLLKSKATKNFLVIGGRSPIALAVANRLTREGKVFLVTRKIDSEIKRETSVDVTLVEGDVNSLSNHNQIEDEVLKDTFSIVFVHRYRGNPDNIEEAMRCEVLDPYMFITKVLSSQKKTAIRNIIFFTSPGAERILGDQPLSYHVAKAALSQTIRYLSVIYARRGISVVGIAPSSFVAKRRSEAFYRENLTLKEKIEMNIPSGEFLNCEEIAEVVSFAANMENLSITGNILKIDHGLGLLEASTLIRG